MNIDKNRRKKDIIRRFNLLKLDCSLYNNSTFFHNKSIDLNLNKTNNKLTNSDFYFKENIDKNRILLTSNNIIDNNKYSIKRLIASNNIIYNRTSKNRKLKLEMPKEHLINNRKYQHSYNSTLDHNKHNININNNIIININSSNYET